MFGLESSSNPFAFSIFTDEPESSAYNTLILLTGVSIAIGAAIQFFESQNHFKYESRLARIIAGFLIFTTYMLHTKKDDLDIPSGPCIVVPGPHRTALVDGLAVVAKVKGEKPLSFFATTDYDSLPLVKRFMDMFGAIPIVGDAKKTGGKSANADALVRANEVIQKGGRVLLFPQGNFAKIGAEPHKVYPGAAILAISQNLPIHVIRLDGFWSLENKCIPLAIRNNAYYRALFSFFHLNNVRTNLCCVIDFHLQPENKGLSDEAKIEEICAQLYAYYCHTEELTDKQIDVIKTQISDKTHHLLWKNKVKKDELSKELSALNKESAEWDQRVSSMGAK